MASPRNRLGWGWKEQGLGSGGGLPALLDTHRAAPAPARHPPTHEARLRGVQHPREGDPHIATGSQWAKTQAPSQMLPMKAFPRRKCGAGFQSLRSA